MSSGEFDLLASLESGQTFQWRRDARGRHVGWVAGRIYRLWQEPLGIGFDSPGGGDARALADYLQLEFNTRALRDRLRRLDRFLRDAVAFAPGMRLLRQDPWECLCGFILSSTKQVAHIKQIWANVSASHGRSVEWDGDRYHRFPAPDVLASLSERQLRDCKMGFRARYLLDAARAVDSGAIRLDLPGELSTREARAYLMRLPGVGAKIADCVLLYAYQKYDSFPRDVWINRVLERIYFRKRRKVAPDEIAALIRDYFGPDAGYAQQYLFHYVRLNPGVLNSKSEIRNSKENAKA